MQDCLENPFSEIRGLEDAHPSTVRFCTCLKLITVHIPKASSYDTDTLYFNHYLLPNLVVFIRTSRNDEQSKVQQDFSDIRCTDGARSKYEYQALYYLCG